MNGVDPFAAAVPVTNTMNNKANPIITVFHCINTVTSTMATVLGGGHEADLRFIVLPCSSMVKDVFLLKAFEAGADAVVVLVCPEGACRYVEGNLRARKRVDLVKKVLDEIGLGGSRLSLFNVAAGDERTVARVIQETRTEVIALGPNPACRLPRAMH